MNRQTKRLMAKQQRAEERAGGGSGRPPSSPGGLGGRGGAGGGPSGAPRKKRTPPRQFIREVRSELKKVAWPSRNEVTTYTLVVLFSVVFITLIIFGLDYGFAKAVLKVFGG
ncbi:MAG: preprotein translocase subunit SecE [Actinomycetota bacterium]|nr:preprotein translocase subunit SecE [Actinomycetota bacterium]